MRIVRILDAIKKSYELYTFFAKAGAPMGENDSWNPPETVHKDVFL